MKKIFLFLLTIAIFSCAGEVYQEEIVIKDGLAYKKDSTSLYSGSVLDRYGEPVGSYKKGTKDGEWIEIDITKGTQRTANYIKGVPDGEQITYVFPGAREKSKRLEYINYENGNPVGIWTQWGRDNENRIRKSGEITFEENGSGRWREWDLNTRAVTRAGDYSSWKRVGTWKSWDANEVIVSEGEYVNGKKEGKWTWFEKGEDKGWEENYVAGILNGKFNNLSDHAENRGKGAYDKGVKAGDWEEYYSKEDGSLERKQSGAYVFGKKEGLWSHYKKNGRRVAEGTYKNDLKEGEWTEGPDIDFASRFYGVGPYVNNEKNGEWNYVAPRKNPTIKGFFTSGSPSGTWEVQYNKEKHTGTFEEVKKKVPKLNEFKF